MSKLRRIVKSVGLGELCGLFGKTRQAYYQHIEYEYRTQASEAIILEIVYDIRKMMGKIGTRKLQRMINEILPDDLRIGRDALFDLLEREKLLIRSRNRRVRTTNSHHHFRKWPNLIRDLVITSPNQLWVSDITYIKTSFGTLYLHLVTDAYSKKIVGWCLSSTLEAKHTISALQMAMRNAGCDLSGLIHHSDRGCQYCCDKYVSILQANGILISMTENGDPRENAIAERVNGILKTEWINDETFTSTGQAIARVADIVGIYNNVRPHLSINYLTPAQAHTMSGEMKRQWKNYYWTPSREAKTRRSSPI